MPTKKKSSKKKTSKKRKKVAKKELDLGPGEGAPRTSEPTPKQPKLKKIGTGDALRRIALDKASCIRPVVNALLAVGCAETSSGLKLTEESINTLGMIPGLHMDDEGEVMNPRLISPVQMRELAEKIDAPIKFDEEAWNRIYPKR